ncbi:MAG: hypothetical protein JWO42_595 [Chloroflexi bacterium]|jgi:predicted secreted protein|nr:hypothetical protein [Chloroflexota bacterium]
MDCPRCGTEIQKPDQRYCHECGAPLPAQAAAPSTIHHGPSKQLTTVSRSQPWNNSPGTKQSLPAAHELLRSVLPSTLQNRIIVGAVTAVVAIFALYMILSWIVASLIHFVLPAAALIAIVYVGFRYLRSRP